MRAIIYHMNQTFSDWRKNKSICYFSLPLEPALWIPRSMYFEHVEHELADINI